MLDFVGYGKSFLDYTLINPIQDIFFYFMVYSFIGWIIENIHSFFTRGYFLKENFLVSPFKPMYGFAPIILLSALNPNASIWFMMLISFVVPTLVELISGILLKVLFGKVWWDYSSMQYSIGGYVCLKFSIYWIALCLALIYFVHPAIFILCKFISPIWNVVWPAVFIYISIDFIYTVYRRRGFIKTYPVR